MKEVLIFGGGITGLGVKELLDYKKVNNILIDDKIGVKSKEIYDMDLSKIEYVVKSPGISFENEYIKYLKENDIKIISEIELAYEYMNKDIKLIGITGTNGKTTTTTKVYEMLKYANINAKLAGNVGISYAKCIKEIEENNEKVEYIVLELSSYQLEYNDKMDFYISLITNLTPDHLSRYKNTEEYYDTKFNIFKGQTPEDYMIINLNDNEILKRLNESYLAKRFYVGIEVETMNSAYISKNNKIKLEKIELNANKFSLKGKHNIENMLFLIAVSKILGIDEMKIQDFLYNTKSLEHRMEDFFEYNHIKFINDSKGTNVESTMKAIDSYEEKICLILGGEDKKIDNTKLVEKIIEKVEKVYLIGTNYNIFDKLFRQYGYENYEILYNIENVARTLKKEIIENKIKDNTIILFSPATSSFDQFLNFEDRGKKFKNVIINEFCEEKNE